MKIILIALLSALAYGISTPFAKIGFNKGLHPDGLALSYGAGLLMFALFTISTKGVSVVFPNSGTVIYGIIAGLVCAIGFKAAAEALAIPSSLASVVSVLIALYPLVTVVISLPLLDEWSKVNVPKLIFGSTGAIVCAYLVSTSIKQ
jgi:uncharacterized membrane protein